MDAAHVDVAFALKMVEPQRAYGVDIVVTIAVCMPGSGPAFQVRMQKYHRQWQIVVMVDQESEIGHSLEMSISTEFPSHAMPNIVETCGRCVPPGLCSLGDVVSRHPHPCNKLPAANYMSKN